MRHTTLPTIAKLRSELLRYRLTKPVGGSGVTTADVIVSTATLSSGATGLGFSYVVGGGGEPAVAWLQEFPMLEPLLTGWPELANDGTIGMRDVYGHGLQLADGSRSAYRVDL
jgi:hypothetical protein